MPSDKPQCLTLECPELLRERSGAFRLPSDWLGGEKCRSFVGAFSKNQSDPVLKTATGRGNIPLDLLLLLELVSCPSPSVSG